MWTVSACLQYRRSGERYASDVTDAEFALIEPLLPAPKRGGRPRSSSLREVLNAILYLCHPVSVAHRLPVGDAAQGVPAQEHRLRRGGFRSRPAFRRFGQDGVWHQIWMVLTMAVREQAEREASPSAGIVDSQSVKTSEAGGPRGFDAGKKICGRKRHLLTDLRQ